jgi:hypothetical protein
MPPGPVALAMTNINGVLARVFVSSLDAAIPCTKNSPMSRTSTTSLFAMCNSLAA